ncbi:PP0621 family protein [Actimicrobium antarcticum]|uniref:Preprotein translocase subunit YajC n=1 Tax=Actimicrobium antarcticum TaxID=1051899 RepID=A0ABP7TAV6_9BURK
MRLLPWLVLLVLVIYVVRKKIRNAVDAQARGARQERPAELDGETMVRCEECGIHIPVSEALPGPGGRVFCSEEHRTRNASS